MKSLTQFINEAHRSWEPEDTDNISEFLSYLFFIAKEQYNTFKWGEKLSQPEINKLRKKEVK